MSAGLAVDALARVEEEEAAPEIDPTCFVFGGVAWEICPSPGVAWSVGAEHRLFTGAWASSPVAGQVHCVVSSAPELSEHVTREITWEWSGDVARVETGRVRAELRRLSPGKYAATAFVVPNEAGCSALVTALTAAVVHREGGFVLHAAGVEIDGRAVLFIGPSGAGKTTAANHCEGARWFARDRAVLYRTPLGWYAAGMAGGDPIALPRTSAPLLPLGAVYRVQRGSAIAVREVLPARALRHLRESIQASRGDTFEEERLVERAMAFIDAVGVRELVTVLGAELTPLLREVG